MHSILGSNVLFLDFHALSIWFAFAVESSEFAAYSSRQARWGSHANSFHETKQCFPISKAYIV